MQYPSVIFNCVPQTGQNLCCCVVLNNPMLTRGIICLKILAIVNILSNPICSKGFYRGYCVLYDWPCSIMVERSLDVG